MDYRVDGVKIGKIYLIKYKDTNSVFRKVKNKDIKGLTYTNGSVCFYESIKSILKLPKVLEVLVTKEELGVKNE